ncbi:MAG TPA: hypothetical protein VFK36_00475 [Gemmatimonadales bacterium]|nr:hypothetical protein [Gemmatimonadales bacterium]
MTRDPKPATLLLALLALLAPPALQSQAAKSAVAEPTLKQVRELTSRYQDVKVALADGYIPDPSGMCVAATMEGRPAEEGAMGVHYVRPDLLGITGPPNPRVNGTSTYTDFRQPAILIYEPQADGSSQLVAVENLVFKKAWEAAGHTAPPTFQGQSFNNMEDNPATEVDEAHGFEPHYDLHVWLYRENPKGMFAQFNPRVKCE